MIGRLPWRMIPPRAFDGDLGPPWPDIWIAAGRATLPLSSRVRRWSGGRTFVVQTQDPRTWLAPFDLVIPPAHDGLDDANVFPILGAPNRLTPERLADSGAYDAYPRPHVAVIVGGRSRAFDLPAAHARELAERIAAAVRAAHGSVLVSFTRRTPPDARAAMTEVFRDLPGEIWDETGDNPYFGYLAAADAILVTEESANLATDAAATGKPVYVLPMVGDSAKLGRFHADLRARGIARPFEGVLDHWTYPPLDETSRAAAELLRRFDMRR